MFDVTLTGSISLCTDGYTVTSIEVLIVGSCERLRSTGLEELRGPANGLKLLWVKPDDLCNGGVPIKHEDLIAAASRAWERIQGGVEFADNLQRHVPMVLP
jgi:hypothetical protein